MFFSVRKQGIQGTSNPMPSTVFFFKLVFSVQRRLFRRLRTELPGAVFYHLVSSTWSTSTTCVTTSIIVMCAGAVHQAQTTFMCPLILRESVLLGIFKSGVTPFPTPCRSCSIFDGLVVWPLDIDLAANSRQPLRACRSPLPSAQVQMGIGVTVLA